MALRCQCWANALAACVAPAYPDDEPDDEPTDEELAQMRREQMEQVLRPATRARVRPRRAWCVAQTRPC